MRLHVTSDLHLENAAQFEMRGNRQIKLPYVLPVTDADAVIIAGDLHNGPSKKKVAACVAPQKVPVYVIAGNHDYYFSSVGNSPFRLLPCVQEITNKIVVRDGVTLIGSTLWSNVGWTDTEHDLDKIRAGVQGGINDFRFIQGWSVAAMLEHNAKDVLFLRKAISEAKGKVVVVSHFSPSRRSIAARFAKAWVNPYFHNELDELTAGVSLWIHGHTHDYFDYVIPETGCRIVCNPKGYGGENNHFNPSFVVEV